MALSGQYNLNLTFEDVAIETLDRLQIIGDGENITPAMRNRVKSSLNLMLKSWESQGIHLWTYTEGSLFVDYGRSEYQVGGSARIGNNFVFTRANAEASAGSSDIFIEPIASEARREMVQVGSNIGIMLQPEITSSGAVVPGTGPFWTTISSIPTVGRIILADPLPVDMPDATFIYTYSSDPLIPIRRVLDCRRFESSDYEIPIVFESRLDYFNLPNKNQLGTPIQVYYSRQEPQGIFYLWSTPANIEQVINFTYERETQIIVNDDDMLDIPTYWLEAVIMNLAEKLTYKFSVSPERRSFISQEARLRLSEALSFDNAVYPIEIKVEQYG